MGKYTICLIGVILSCNKQFVQVPRLPQEVEAGHAKEMQLTFFIHRFQMKMKYADNDLSPVFALFVALGLGPFTSPRRCWYFWEILIFWFLKVSSLSQMIPVLSASCSRMTSWSSFFNCFQLATCANLQIWQSLSQTLPCMQKIVARGFSFEPREKPLVTTRFHVE